MYDSSTNIALCREGNTDRSNARNNKRSAREDYSEMIKCKHCKLNINLLAILIVIDL